MAHATRTRIAALVTLLSLGGLSAIGLGLRSQGEAQTTAELATKVKPRVIHKRKYVDVPAASATGSAAPVAAYQAAAPVPAVVQTPTKVATQVSPTGGGGYEDEDEVEHENEVEHEFED
jgi:hypothetical protein